MLLRLPLLPVSELFDLLAEVVGVLVFATALGFFVSATNDKDDAEQQQHRATSAVTSTRKDVQNLKSAIYLEQGSIKERVGAQDSIMPLVLNVADASSRMADSAVSIQQLGASGAVGTPEVSAAIDEGNQRVTEYDDILSNLRGLATGG